MVAENETLESGRPDVACRSSLRAEADFAF